MKKSKITKQFTPVTSIIFFMVFVAIFGYGSAWRMRQGLGVTLPDDMMSTVTVDALPEDMTMRYNLAHSTAPPARTEAF